MSDRTRIFAGAVAGAFAGSLTAYLLCLPRGRRRLAEVNPALDELSLLLRDVRTALRKGQAVAREVRGVGEDLTAMIGGDELPDAGRPVTGSTS